jgi:hypothetical protein
MAVHAMLDKKNIKFILHEFINKKFNKYPDIFKIISAEKNPSNIIETYHLIVKYALHYKLQIFGSSALIPYMIENKYSVKKMIRYINDIDVTGELDDIKIWMDSFQNTYTCSSNFKTLNRYGRNIISFHTYIGDFTIKIDVVENKNLNNMPPDFKQTGLVLQRVVTSFGSKDILFNRHIDINNPAGYYFYTPWIQIPIKSENFQGPDLQLEIIKRAYRFNKYLKRHLPINNFNLPSFHDIDLISWVDRKQSYQQPVPSDSVPCEPVPPSINIQETTSPTDEKSLLNRERKISRVYSYTPESRNMDMQVRYPCCNRWYSVCYTLRHLQHQIKEAKNKKLSFISCVNCLRRPSRC